MLPESLVSSSIHPVEHVLEPAATEPWWRRRPRVVGLLAALPAWAVLIVALLLEPDPHGMGTHERLGMPPCGFLQTTGLPCPSCGMTTSFAAMAHGRILEALYAQVAGAVLFLVTLGAAGVGTAQALSGRAILSRLRFAAWWVYALLVLVAVGWGIKLMLGLNDGTLPVR